MKILNLLVCFIICILWVGCHKPSSPETSYTWQTLAGRHEDHPPLYRALVPSHWIRQDPSTDAFIVDTTQPICRFMIYEDGQTVSISIHTFPNRIPPQAQISRWKQQFEELDPLKTKVVSDSHGGFSGFYFEGEGRVQGRDTKVIGWSMQLAPLYDRLLSSSGDPIDLLKRADYTIKVDGSPKLLNKYHSELLNFAQSFEFIDELPNPT